MLTVAQSVVILGALALLPLCHKLTAGFREKIADAVKGGLDEAEAYWRRWDNICWMGTSIVAGGFVFVALAFG